MKLGGKATAMASVWALEKQACSDAKLCGLKKPGETPTLKMQPSQLT
jgi:hypothetical protein